MEYIAGLFDAEGYVTLCPNGGFKIGTEMANEEIPNMFKDTFGGHIYVRQRDKRKKTWSWILADAESVLNFIKLIEPFVIIKKGQLTLIRDYLDQTREYRKLCRDYYIHQIAKLKKPPSFDKSTINIETIGNPTEAFWKWLAGFFDGDGNFCVYEYQGTKSKIFDSWISVFNIFPSVIVVVKRMVNGSISKYKGAKFPIWKWVCCQKDSEFVCNSVYPYLRIKKEQCKLVSEFLEIKKTKIREQSYSFDQTDRIRDIIKQIKHLNSL